MEQALYNGRLYILSLQHDTSCYCKMIHLIGERSIIFHGNKFGEVALAIYRNELIAYIHFINIGRANKY